ncbi:MAG: molybdopterin-dependent oxidoreductase [Chloroflexota bacterium]
MGQIRRERPNRAKVVVIDPRYSVTAAKSDQWLPINPGTDGALAMGIANVIINENLYDDDFVQTRTAGFQEYKDLVSNEYRPERVAAITGIEAQAIRQIAREFAQTKPAIAWTGRGVCGWPNGSYNSYAIFCLNALTGNIDVPGGIIYQETPEYKNMPEPVVDETARQGNTKPKLGLDNATSISGAGASVNKVADAILNNEPYLAEMAIGFSSNFNMSAPDTERWDRAMKKLPYYVHIASFTSEMAEYADIILPATTFLEEWGYDHSPPGSGFAEVKLKQPAVKPQFEAKSTVDIIFEIARELGGTVTSAFTGIGDSAEGFAKYRTETLLPWDEFRGKGVWVGSAYQYRKYDSIFHTPSGKFEFYSGNLEKTGMRNGRLSNLPHYEDMKFIGDKNTYPLILSTYQPLLDVENGGQNYPWAQENYLILQGVGWTNFAEINRETAHSLGIKDGDLVWVESQVGRIEAKARVTEGIHPQIVSIASGQGHWTGGKWQKDIGVNPNEIIGIDYDGLSGQSAHLNTRVKIYRV